MLSCCLVDDGTEEDHDSHIMVWSLTSSPPYLPPTPSPPPPPSSLPSCSTLSSIDLGDRSPGSGLAMDSSRHDSEVEEAGEVGLQGEVEWALEVESMLAGPPPSILESFHLSSEPSHSLWLHTSDPPPNVIHEEEKEVLQEAPNEPPATKESPSPPSTLEEPEEDFTGHLANSRGQGRHRP